MGLQEQYSTVISQIIEVINFDLGNLSPTRDLTYVDDTCEGLIQLAKSKKLFGH